MALRHRAKRRMRSGKEDPLMERHMEIKEQNKRRLEVKTAKRQLIEQGKKISDIDSDSWVLSLAIKFGVIR